MATTTARVKSTAKAPSKGEVLRSVAEETGLSRKQVSSVMESLGGQIINALGRKGPGTFIVPGLMKIKVVNKPATKERTGINPFTGQEQVFKAKPASRAVKIRPLKNMKEMVK